MNKKDRAELSRLTRLCRQDMWRGMGGRYYKSMMASEQNNPRGETKKRAKARKASKQQTTGTAQRRAGLQELSSKVTSAEFYGIRSASLSDAGYASYEEYLASDKWAKIRRRILKMDRWTCRMCGEVATEVHHTSYRRTAILGTDASHLHSLCRGCHELAEFVDGNPDGQRRTPADMVRTVRENIGRQSKHGDVRPRDDKGTVGGSPCVGLSSLATRPQEIVTSE